jgi:plasmid maintenance system antidote protein VapI
LLTKHKQRHTLPKHIHDEFRKLATASGDTEKQEKLQRRLNLIHLLADAGWTYTSIGDAIGVSRERVRQLANNKPAEALASVVEIPKPPAPAVYQKKVLPVPSGNRLERLLELQPVVQLVRSYSPKFREEAEEYTSLMYKVYKEDGVSMNRIAKMLGITQAAVNSRLIRYGYKPACNSSNACFNPVITANRALR